MRKFIPYILIIVVVAVFAFGPFAASEARAEGGFFDITGTVIKKIVAVIGTAIMTVSSVVLGVAGLFFDVAIKYGITDANASTNTVVESGWTLTRDLANIFFIFILLYISIATILRLSGYGIKDLLVKVVLIALLVNFSLMFTRVIIDASNVLALEFYTTLSNITIKGDTTGRTLGLSEAIVTGLNPQKLFEGSSAFEKTNKDGTVQKMNQEGTLMQIVIITSMGSALLLITGFVLFAAGIMFVIRTVILWLLMILAPLAFVAMILPATKQYASKWWDMLFSQAFFAPAYLFMFYIAVKLTAEGGIVDQVILDNNNFGSAFGTPNDSNIKLVYNFVVLIVLMLAALIVAKTLGGYAGETGLKWAHSARTFGQGYAGRITRRAAAPLAERVATGDGRIAKTLRGIPLVAKGAATIASRSRARISEAQKKYENFSDPELKNMIPKMAPFERTAVIQEMAKRGNLDDVTAGDIARTKKIMGRYGMNTSSLDALRPDLITDRKARDKALTKANWQAMGKDTLGSIFTVPADNAGQADKERFNADMAAIVENIKPAGIQKIYEETEQEAADSFFKALKTAVEKGTASTAATAWTKHGVGEAVMDKLVAEPGGGKKRGGDNA